MKNYKLILSTAVIATMIGCTNPEKYDTPKPLNGVCGELTVNRSVTAITSTATATTKKYVDDGVEGDNEAAPINMKCFLTKLRAT